MNIGSRIAVWSAKSGDPYEVFNKYCLFEKFDCIIPRGTTELHNYQFSRHPIGKIFIPNTVVTFGAGGIFENCGATEIEIENGLTLIPAYFARGNSFERIILPDSIKETGWAAFGQAGVTLVPKYISLGTGIESVASFFTQGSANTEILISKALTPPALGGVNCFYFVPSAKIFVPDASVDAYKNAQYWSTYASKIYPMSEMTEEEYNKVYGELDGGGGINA